MLKHKRKLLYKPKAQKFNISFFVVFRYWLNQNNSKIQLMNLARLTFLDFEFIRETIEFGHVGMMCTIFINILSTVSFEMFIGTCTDTRKSSE